MKIKTIIGLFSLITSASVLTAKLNASELVYTPINPSFGGSALNGSFLLSKAQSQNKHKAPINQKSYAERFQESLERAYINKLVREITDVAFGETCEAGDDSCGPSLFDENSVFTSGDHVIEVVTSNTDSLTVKVTNSLTGEVTVIEIPRFG